MIEKVEKELKRNEKLLHQKENWKYDKSYFIGRVQATRDILKLLKPDTLQQCNIPVVTNRNSKCKCKKVNSYRMDGIGRYRCGKCDNLLTKEQSNDIARAEASYYGW